MKLVLDWKEYAQIVRKAGAEGCVLLKNDNECLPLKENDRVALFGRTQFDYIKSGTGSGGLVNVPYVVNIYDGLKGASVNVYEKLADGYREWLKDHPFDKGVGWAGEPFSQVEMEVSDEVIRDCKENADVAIVVIGRLAGEDKDNKAEKGSYLLRDDEEALLKKVTSAFKRTVVLLNSGNIIDMKWVKEYNPAAVMYIWQGGVEGGNAAADVLTGKVNPSGHLTDTIAYDFKDYPSSDNFGDEYENIYTEDIFVGYRYFETFAKDKVLYPFGYGLSYTTFNHSSVVDLGENEVNVRVTVENTGKVAGKEAVMLFFKAPNGKLSKAERELVQFAKTNTIFAGAKEDVTLSFDLKAMACYDDGGYTGHANAWVLEPGVYELFEGNNVRDAKKIFEIAINSLVVIKETEDALSPIKPFKRMVNNNGTVSYEDVPTRKVDTKVRIEEERKKLKELPYLGEQKYKLKDVRDGKVSLDTFIQGLSDEEMIQMTRGEGMCSKRVCPGTAAAFAGSTDVLESYGIPACCCSDGPSGIRMDSGAMAMQGPNGVCLACTFDRELLEEVYEYMGRELRFNKIDSLLGPGMNIHRNPLNGRNFEYFSEDPFLTGAMAVAELKGLHKNGVTGTIKHFSCNNEEVGRHTGDSVVSKRALREIYLKGFEMAVVEGGAYNIMTTYGILNGTHTASNFEQNILVVRNDWHYDGLLETDWWTLINEEGKESSRQYTSFMIRGGNDVYMVTGNAATNANEDDAMEGLKKGIFTRAELQRNVRHILLATMKTLSFERLCSLKDEWEEKNRPQIDNYEKVVKADVEIFDGAVIDPSIIDTSKETMNLINLSVREPGNYKLLMDVSAKGSELSQISMAISLAGTIKKVVNKNGADDTIDNIKLDLETAIALNKYMGIYFNQDGMKLSNISIIKE